MKYTSIILINLLVACGQFNYIEPDLAILTGEFIADCHKYHNNKCLDRFDSGISIGVAAPYSLDEAGNHVVGICYGREYNRHYPTIRKVLIDKDYVEQGGLMLKAVLYHELAHCLLACGHNSANVIMKAEIGTIESEEELNTAIIALFNGCK